jgi:hypothetical protein
VQAIEKHPRDFERSHPMEIINYLDFVEEQNGLEFLKNYFVGIDRPTFEYASYFINILEWFEGKLEDDRNFLKNFALKTDENGDSCLASLMKHSNFDELHDLYYIYHSLTEITDKPFAKKNLFKTNHENKNCLNVYFEVIDNAKIIEILDHFLGEFENDRDFCIRFINDGLKEKICDREVQMWMEKKLSWDLVKEYQKNLIIPFVIMCFAFLLYVIIMEKQKEHEKF